jgi:hypothetical protein
MRFPISCVGVMLESCELSRRGPTCSNELALPRNPLSPQALAQLPFGESVVFAPWGENSSCRCSTFLKPTPQNHTCWELGNGQSTPPLFGQRSAASLRRNDQRIQVEARDRSTRCYRLQSSSFLFLPWQIWRTWPRIPPGSIFPSPSVSVSSSFSHTP